MIPNKIELTANPKTKSTINAMIAQIINARIINIIPNVFIYFG